MLSQNPMVSKAVKAARRAARGAVEGVYEGTCTVVEYASTVDEKTKVSRQGEVVVLRDQPCRLSFEKISAALQADVAAKVSQGVKLFIAPEVRVNPGSKVIVTQNGVTGEYAASGEPAVYHSHQEVWLDLFGGGA